MTEVTVKEEIKLYKKNENIAKIIKAWDYNRI